MQLPSMLLQPLVENCIKHGLSSNKVEGGAIRLGVRGRAENRLHLTVEDDGVGIPESKLATLLEQGIGVSNVNERLKVLFGNDYRMWIDSQPGRGTRIEIEIPELQTNLAAVFMSAASLRREFLNRARIPHLSRTVFPSTASPPHSRIARGAYTIGCRLCIRFRPCSFIRARTGK